MADDFQARSRDFLRAVSKSAAWMMSRNVGSRHWWRWPVLTERNPDSSRPVFDDGTAKEIFAELERRELLVEISLNWEGQNLPAYLMRYDIEAWDKAVSDGRPLYGRWLKFRRNWLVLLLAFVLGCLLTSIENQTVGLIDHGLDVLMGHQHESSDVAGEAERNGSEKAKGGAGESEGASTPPNHAAAPDGSAAGEWQSR